MNFVLINQFYPPAQAPTGLLLGDLAGELVRRGHAVTVIASAAGYGAEVSDSAAAEDPVRVVRVGPGGHHRSGIAAKFGEYLAFYRSAWRECSRLPDPPDALVCMTTPPFIGLLGAHLRKTSGIPYVLWCMDLYPEALLANGFLRDWNPLKPLLRRLARLERSSAAAVIALGPDMATLLSAAGAARSVEIPVWTSLSATPAAQAEARELRCARGWEDDEIVLLYSGNMGRAHRAEEFAALAEQLRGSAPRCRFVFSGIGPLRTEWERRWGGLFEFMPPVPARECAAHLLSADIHLVSQQPEWTGIVVPSKFQAACALGKPVVFAGPPDSAVAGWMNAADVGWILPPGNAAEVAAAAREVGEARLRVDKGRRALELCGQRFTPARNCGKIADMLERVVRERI